ncbi:hypothetical protein [Microvirga guangxiensis]|uniref:Uncharacterized protein n=1 Tax=Microvirga guangxiensis TaxID=549386 RepID=A0A1G5LNZ2_9HYPH|nr:hypothetical protein [Microvirga guangxiensis]SCZ14546.1 hypothetical protein SAMN02927923_04560 [Microvirga guangxiensis]
MTLLNLFSSRARMGNGDIQSDDRSILLMVVLLLGLVFVPIIGLHVAAVALGPEAGTSPPDNLAHHATPPKPTRG